MSLLMKNNVFIGIDPDLKASGVAVWLKKEKSLTLSTLDLFDLMALVNSYPISDVWVFLEAGWLNRKSDFHKHKNHNERVIAATARNVGENHASGKQIEAFLKKSGIKYTLIRPTAAKWTAEVFQNVTKLKTRTNQDTRDAARLVFGR